MARLFVLCVIVGSTLLMMGVRRWKRARQQGVLLILLGILLNAWWVVFLVMDGLKNIAHWR